LRASRSEPGLEPAAEPVQIAAEAAPLAPAADEEA
jgi:hypothetical protein